MKVIWANAPATANQVVGALAGQRDWKPKTIHTLLRRLADKGVLMFERKGREYVFHPRLEQQEYTRSAARSFLDRHYGGSLAPFLAAFLERERLSPGEIAELRRILEEKSR